MDILNFVKSSINSKAIRRGGCNLGAYNNLLCYCAALQIRIKSEGHVLIRAGDSKSGAPFSLIDAN